MRKVALILGLLALILPQLLTAYPLPGNLRILDNAPKSRNDNRQEQGFSEPVVEEKLIITDSWQTFVPYEVAQSSWWRGGASDTTNFTAIYSKIAVIAGSDDIEAVFYSRAKLRNATIRDTFDLSAPGGTYRDEWAPPYQVDSLAIRCPTATESAEVYWLAF